MPVMAKSNEATKEQLAYAKAEGDSVSRCIDWILANAGGAKGQVAAGEYLITYAITKPEGWYEYSNNNVTWHKPGANDDAHLWLFVQDGADKRVVTPLTINYTLFNDKGSVVKKHNIPFVWTPLLNGYGDNITLSGDGSYTLQLSIDALPYRRHDPYNGDRFYAKTQASIPLNIRTQELNAQPLSEAMEAQHALSKKAGDAYSNTLQEMYSQANDGRDTTLNDYVIAYAIEYAEGYWHYEKDKFRYMQENDMSGKTNAHVEVSVRDAQTGRFMHNLDVTSTLTSEDGKTVDTMKEPFMWHPWLYHYGENWRVPKAGNYNLHIHFLPPAYHRYGKTDGKQFTHAVDIDFKNIIVKTGQK